MSHLARVPPTAHASNAQLAPFLRADHCGRGDLDRETRAARVERRIGRRLTQAEESALHWARSLPQPMASRAHYHAAGFRLLVSGGRLVLACNGRSIFGSVVS